jgi:hypothetical protein
MNWYGLENEVARRKDETRRLAGGRQPVAAERPTPRRHRLALAVLGTALIAAGLRLQAEYAHMADAGPELAEPLTFSRNGVGPNH